jgi:hypothetical protein
MISIEEMAQLMKAPLYVTDEGKVTCNGTCDEGGFLWRVPARRVTVRDFLDALAEHYKADGCTPQ